MPKQSVSIMNLHNFEPLHIRLEPFAGKLQDPRSLAPGNATPRLWLGPRARLSSPKPWKHLLGFQLWEGDTRALRRRCQDSDTSHSTAYPEPWRRLCWGGATFRRSTWWHQISQRHHVMADYRWTRENGLQKMAPSSRSLFGAPRWIFLILRHRSSPMFGFQHCDMLPAKHRDLPI